MGRWQNDIKEATVKWLSSMAQPNLFVSPNPTDLAGVAVVSESLKVLTSVGR